MKGLPGLSANTLDSTKHKSLYGQINSGEIFGEDNVFTATLYNSETGAAHTFTHLMQLGHSAMTMEAMLNQCDYKRSYYKFHYF